MNQDERERVAKSLLGCYSVFGKDLSRDAVLFMVDTLDDFSGNQIVEAIKTYSIKEKTGRPPTVGALVEIMNPETSQETVANDAAARIFQAIGKFGWADIEGASRFIGPLGWSVVERFGGWLYLCENHGSEISATTFHAQARDLAKSHMELSRLGKLGHAHELPEIENDTVKKLVNIKSVTK